MKHISAIWLLLLALLCAISLIACGDESRPAADFPEQTEPEMEETTAPPEVPETEDPNVCPKNPNAKGHAWSKWATVSVVSCAEEGKKERQCSLCGKWEYEITEMLPHDESDWQYDAYPSRSQAGKRYKTCWDCGDVTAEEILPQHEFSQGLKYKVNDDGKTCVITGRGECRDNELLIPAQYESFTVVAIAENAFYKDTKIQTVILPDTLTQIGAKAFGASTLTAIEIPQSVTKIGEAAFSGCTQLKTVKLSSGISEIPKNTFHSCESLISIEIPDSVTLIGDYAFYSCDALTSIRIPDSVTAMREGAFMGCGSLTEVTLSASLQSIAKYGFSGCTSLVSITIPETVLTLREFCFNSCKSLREINLSSKTVTISDAAFSGASSLKDLVLPATIKTIGDISNGTLYENIYYLGTKEDWKAVNNHGMNFQLTLVLAYYSEEEPESKPQNYWHYVDGMPTRWG